ncbi:hypothetical protein MMC30_004503 [Trapelia coarctata]|nr:hypothetical protein [Trapelia coarctata]
MHAPQTPLLILILTLLALAFAAPAAKPQDMALADAYRTKYEALGAELEAEALADIPGPVGVGI